MSNFRGSWLQMNASSPVVIGLITSNVIFIVVIFALLWRHRSSLRNSVKRQHFEDELLYSVIPATAQEAASRHIRSTYAKAEFPKPRPLRFEGDFMSMKRSQRPEEIYRTCGNPSVNL